MFKGGAGDRRAKTNGNSHSRLFGEPDRQSTPAKQHMRSNIPIGGEKAAIATVSNGHDHATNGHSNGVAKTNGHHQNGGGSSSSSTNGDHVDHPRQPRGKNFIVHCIHWSCIVFRWFCRCNWLATYSIKYLPLLVYIRSIGVYYPFLRLVCYSYDLRNTAREI